MMRFATFAPLLLVVAVIAALGLPGASARAPPGGGASVLSLSNAPHGILTDALRASNVTQVPTKSVTVDLDLAPYDRWHDVCAGFSQYAEGLAQYLEDILNMSRKEEALVEKAGELLVALFGDEGREELRGCADGLGVDPGMLGILNLSYELRRLGGGIHNSTGPCPPSGAPHAVGEPKGCVFGNSTAAAGNVCTSIVARGPDRVVRHGRNFDWNIPNSLRGLAVTLHFTRSGAPVFTSGGMIGFIGVITAMKAGQFTASIDARDLGGSIGGDIAASLTHPKAMGPCFLLRKTMETAKTYSEAVEMLAQSELVAPVYYIVGGLGSDEGALLSRGREAVYQPRYLSAGDDVGVDAGGGRDGGVDNGGDGDDVWYLLETNYDHWETPPSYDDRRSYGLRYMDQLTQAKADTEGLHGVMNTWPIMNDATSMTVMMSAADGNFTAYINYWNGPTY